MKNAKNAFSHSVKEMQIHKWNLNHVCNISDFPQKVGVIFSEKSNNQNKKCFLRIYTENQIRNWNHHHFYFRSLRDLSGFF